MVRVSFRVGVNRDVALVEMRDHRLLVRPSDGLLGDQHGHAGTLRFVILPRHIEDVRADDVRDLGQNRGQPLGVVGLIDVLDVLLLLRRRPCVADVVDIERQALGQVVETVELQLAAWGHGDSAAEGSIRWNAGARSEN